MQKERGPVMSWELRWEAERGYIGVGACRFEDNSRRYCSPALMYRYVLSFCIIFVILIFLFIYYYHYASSFITLFLLLFFPTSFVTTLFFFNWRPLFLIFSFKLRNWQHQKIKDKLGKNICTGAVELPNLNSI